MTTAAVIVAAGRGTRAGEGPPKQWRDLGGVPVLARSVAAFGSCDRVVVALHPDDMDRGIALFRGSVTLVAGGETRAASVRSALEAIDGSDVTRVLIHDAARPFATSALIGRVLDALGTGPPVLSAIQRAKAAG